MSCQTSVVLLGHVSSLNPFVFVRTIYNINHDTAVQEMDLECVLLEEYPSCGECCSRRRSKEKMDSCNQAYFQGNMYFWKLYQETGKEDATLPSKVTCGRRV